MKQLILFLSVSLLFGTVGFAQQSQEEMKEKRQQITEMMQDSTLRAIMMDRIAHHPDMRQQMMRDIMQTMKSDTALMGEKMQRMRNNPEMKTHMQQYISKRYQMMEGEQIPLKMHDMEDDLPVMKLSMKCMQMMQDGVLGKGIKHHR